MGQILVSRSAITHNDYLLLDDGTLFAVFGDSHPESSVIGMPYYLPAAQSDILLSADTQLVDYLGNSYIKFRPHDGESIYVGFIDRSGDRYTWVQPGKTFLVAVRRPRILKVLSPMNALRTYVKNYSPLHPVSRLLADAASFKEGLQAFFGLGGSTLLHGDVASDSSDIDLIVYGEGNPILVREFCKFLVRRRGYKYLSGSVFLEYARRRNRRFIALRQTRETLLRRRWDTLISPEGRLIDFSFSRLDSPRWFEWGDLGETICIRTKVLDDSESFFAPSMLGVEHEAVKTICITTRGYGGLFKRGDTVTANGRLFERSNEKVLFVDDAAGDTITLE